MSRRLGIPVHPAASAAEAVRGADIVNTATTSAKPVLDGHDIAEGAHINAIGANHAHKRELDDTAISRADVIFVDSIEQSKQEAGDLIIPFQQQPQKWDAVHELDQLVADKVPGRASEKQTTLFKSNGIASWDLAVAEKVYSLARQKNLGRELPFFASGK
jgi:ornithine cyclodeaminase/alanine dehydrogenase-like protein (mu-crystallin family)